MQFGVNGNVDFPIEAYEKHYLEQHSFSFEPYINEIDNWMLGSEV